MFYRKKGKIRKEVYYVGLSLLVFYKPEERQFIMSGIFSFCFTNHPYPSFGKGGDAHVQQERGIMGTIWLFLKEGGEACVQIYVMRVYDLCAFCISSEGRFVK